MIHSTLWRDALDRYLEEAPSHLLPIIEAVRHQRVGLMFVGQGGNPFRLPAGGKQPAITVIGDDLDEAFGPDGFHMPSVRRIIRASRTFAVVSCEALEPIYDSIAFAVATTRNHGLIVETQPGFEAQWVGLIRKLAPGRPLTIGTVKGGRA